MVEAACSWQMRLLSGADPLMVSLVTAAMQFTVMLAVVPAGVLADIIDRRKLVLVSHVWLALVLAALAGLMVAGMLTPLLLLLLVPAIALTQAVRMPVVGSLVVDAVDRPSLGAAVALNALGQNASRFVGPAFGGLLLGVGGAPLALVIAAVGLLFAGATLATIAAPAHASRGSFSMRRFMDDAREEQRYLSATEWKRNLLIRFGGFFLCASAIPGLLPVVFDSGRTYGLMLSLYGIGAVLGLLLLGASALGAAGERRAVFAHGVHACGLLLLAFSGGTTWLAAAALLACGASWLALSNAMMTAAQLQLPAAARGRGLSIVYAVGMAGLAIGGPTWGFIARHMGIDVAFATAGVVSLALIAATRHLRFTAAHAA